MPTYKVTDPTTGKSLRITGDSPPTEQELNEVFAGVESKSVAPVEDKMPLGTMAIEAVKNIPSSAVETGKAFIEPFKHPIETGKQIGKLVIGGAEKLIPGRQEQEETFDQFTSFLKERYGNVENVKKTIAKDPVGFSTDLASIFTGGGAVIKGIGTAGKLSKVATVGKIIEKSGTVFDPYNVAKLALKAPFKAAPQNFIKKAYESAAKFSTVLTEKQRNNLVNTALKHDITPTVRGLRKSRQLIDDYNDQITNMIEEASKTNQKIPIGRMFDGFDDLKQSLMENSGEPIKASKAVDSVKSEILKAENKLNRSELSPIEAQKKKQRIYRELEKEYTKISLHPVRVEVRMAIAKNLKESIEEIIPEVKQLNAKEGALIELNKSIQRSANRIQNRDIMGIGVPIKGGVGGIIGGAEGAIAAITFGLLDTPAIKSRLAIVVNNLKNKGIILNPSHTLFRMGLLETGELTKRTAKEEETKKPTDSLSPRLVM